MLYRLDQQCINETIDDTYDLIINTHGDIDPYFHNKISERNTITYCHYPSAKNLINIKDEVYLKKYIKIEVFEGSTYSDNKYLKIEGSQSQRDQMQNNKLNEVSNIDRNKNVKIL